MPVINMVQALNQALREEMERDRDVVLLGEDVGVDGGVFRVTEGLYKEFGGQRVMDTPLAESGIVGLSIGLAAAGFKPVAEIQFMGFIYPALDQLFSHAARLRSRSRGRFTCPLVVRTPYGGGIKAIELHSESTEALFCHVPGLKVVVPASPYYAKGLLISAIRDPDPVIFLEPSRLYRMIKEEVPEGPYAVPIGQARVVKTGKSVTIASWGSMLHKAIRAAEGHDAEIIDMMTLVPFDEETVLNSVKKTGRLLIAHEAHRTCGFGAEIAATAAEEAMMHMKAPVRRVAAYDVVMPFAKLEDYFQPGANRIKEAIEELERY